MAQTFPRLRALVEEFFSGDHSKDDCNALLDQIAMGEGLDEQEKAMAARLEALGAEDNNPDNGASPEYRRGWREGFTAGFMMAGQDRNGS